jgi:SAM-dependent methyltransferase
MRLKSLRRHWEEFARRDAMWAILTAPGKEGGAWDPAEFFATGETDVARFMEQASSLGLPRERRAALDFGCGVGRVTQALCGHFERAVGVDISPTMIAQANRYNRHGERCTYRQSDASDLAAFPDASFDLVFSHLVLQHIRPHQSKRYICEFVRLLRPGGQLTFQVPSGPTSRRSLPRQQLDRALSVARARLRREPLMEMNGLPMSDVEDAIVSSGGALLRADGDGGRGGWFSYKYWATK